MKKSVVLLFAGVVVCALILVFARKGADGGRGQIVPNTRAENDQPSDLAVTSIDGAPRTAV